MELTFRKVIEIIWILVSFVGFGAALYGMVDVYKDYCAAKQFKGRGVSYLIARSMLRAQGMRSTKLLFLLIAGSISFSVPPLTPWRAYVLILLLTFVTIITATDSVMDRIAKGKVMRRLAKGDDRQLFDVTGDMPVMRRDADGVVRTEIDEPRSSDGGVA